MRLAVIGGSFNPVHVGHLALADEVRSSLGYDRVLLIPAAEPPHKVLCGGASAEDRLEMLRLAVDDSPWLSVEPCEIERGGVSWTIDTLEYLYSSLDSLEGKIALVIGADLAPGFSSWRRAGEIASLADIVLAKRPLEAASGGEAEPVAFAYPHIPLDNPPLAISSRDIRRRITQAQAWRYLVPDAVYRYIDSHGLYVAGNP